MPVVDFEYFRTWAGRGARLRQRIQVRRPPFDPVSMLKALILQTQHNLRDARMEFMTTGPALVDAVPGFRPRRPDAGREHDPAVPQQTNRERDAEAGHEGVRLAAPEEGLHPPSRRLQAIACRATHSGQDRGREPGPGAEAAQHRWREGSGQSEKIRQGDLAGRARQGRPERHERAPLAVCRQTTARQWPDPEVGRQGPVSAGRHAAADDRRAGLRIQEPHLHRPVAR